MVSRVSGAQHAASATGIETAAAASSRVTSFRSVRVTRTAYLNIDKRRYSHQTLNIDIRQYTKDSRMTLLDLTPPKQLSSRMTGLPVAIIGAGPIGLATAANLADRGIDFVVLEAGDRVG